MRTKITPEQAIEAFKRYQDGEKITDLAREFEVSNSTIGALRDEFQRKLHSRIGAMVSLALQCGSNMDDITKSIERGINWYARDTKKDFYELLKKTEGSNRFEI